MLPILNIPFSLPMAQNHIKTDSIGLQLQAERWCEQEDISHMLPLVGRQHVEHTPPFASTALSKHGSPSDRRFPVFF